MAKQNHISSKLRGGTRRASATPPVMVFLKDRIALFFVFRLYNRNYEGTEVGGYRNGHIGVS